MVELQVSKHGCLEPSTWNSMTHSFVGASVILVKGMGGFLSAMLPLYFHNLVTIKPLLDAVI